MTKSNLVQYKNQILAAIAANMIALAHGTMLGWMSPTLNLLHTADSPLKDGITTEEESWIGSCISIGGFTGTLIYGSLLDRIGRKYTLLLLGIPNFCGWITIYFSTEVYHLYIARYLSGLTGGGLYVTVPIFIAEIANNNIRGSLGSMLVFIANIGLTFGYSLTAYLPYRIVPVITMWIPIIFTLMVAYLPETPRFYLLNGRENDAEISYKFYTNLNGNTKEEFQKFNKGFQELRDSLKSSIANESKRKLKDFCNPVAIKAILACIVIVIHNQVTGSFVILNYSAKIFAAAGTSLDPNLCTIVMGITQIIGTYCATILVDHFGRKPLFNLSLFGMLLGLVTTGVYDYFSGTINLDNYSWIPIISVSFVIFSASFGVNPLVVLIIVELLPGKIRSIASMGCLLILSSFAFISLKVFPILMDLLNLYGVMWLCAGFCFTGIIFITLAIPETRGKVLQEGDEEIVEENKC
ncbi:facilitated trehalose transporter Tret1-like [Condylostylus longicornis]|uniref:facilitated trehalose transporter Tret1-like n=1 Tax=Condylostylus longicornis TaxID=2530218 RepID=UPI00244E5510|nr:facilitated trehalose transporter Tret1-like [Condylostylus longicornis]